MTSILTRLPSENRDAIMQFIASECVPLKIWFTSSHLLRISLADSVVRVEVIARICRNPGVPNHSATEEVQNVLQLPLEHLSDYIWQVIQDRPGMCIYYEGCFLRWHSHELESIQQVIDGPLRFLGKLRVTPVCTPPKMACSLCSCDSDSDDE